MPPEGSEIFLSRERYFFFFSVSPFASAERKIDQGKEFTIAEVTVQFVHYIQAGRS